MRTIDADTVFEGICDKCDKKNGCMAYQSNLRETDRILFGCMKVDEVENETD